VAAARAGAPAASGVSPARSLVYALAVAAPGKPLVTANQVTVARLVPMPLLAWLVYQGDTGWWWAMGLAAIVGSTDYVDGQLARKHGPTVLGALLDPLADKVFLALLWIPLADLRFAPASAVALMFAREFLVTSMRSAYAQRGIQFKTSYLAKVKTWVQMQGVGTITLCVLVDRTGALLILGTALAVPLLAFVILGLVRGRWYRNLWVAAAFSVVPIALYLIGDARGDLRIFVHGATWILTVLTWVSGLDYLVGGLPRLRAAGGFGRADLVRVIAAGALPLLAVAVMVHTPAPAWPLLALLTFELALGGLDNLLSVHERAPAPLLWAARTLGAVALLGGALAVPDHAAALTIAAAALSALGAAVEFWRGRDLLWGRTEAPPSPSRASESRGREPARHR